MNFCHTFCADTHLAHLPPRSCGAKELSQPANKKICQTPTHSDKKKSNKISPTALLKTGGQECKMTEQTKQDISNDCLTAHWRNSGCSAYMNSSAINKHGASRQVSVSKPLLRQCAKRYVSGNERLCKQQSNKLIRRICR